MRRPGIRQCPHRPHRRYRRLRPSRSESHQRTERRRSLPLVRNEHGHISSLRHCPRCPTFGDRPRRIPSRRHGAGLSLHIFLVIPPFDPENTQTRCLCHRPRFHHHRPEGSRHGGRHGDRRQRPWLCLETIHRPNSDDPGGGGKETESLPFERTPLLWLHVTVYKYLSAQIRPRPGRTRFHQFEYFGSFRPGCDPQFDRSVQETRKACGSAKPVNGLC
mmetsp:Transcript_34171/g.48566  ORF Transcript_34171/g.48566 Transcript_34171/m.48566 type:complete len:218 (+) Transcript_34171:303-956(+)